MDYAPVETPMKLRIYFKPWLAATLLAAAAGLAWLAIAVLPWPWRALALPLALLYTLLTALSAWSLWRLGRLERWMDWPVPQRLLVLAPHEDDCVISAGGIGLRNAKLGGSTLVLYLARDEAPGMAAIRAAEAAAAWKEAGLGPANLRHLDLLPPLTSRDPARLRRAAAALRSIIDEFAPTVVVMPMQEGGHVHHDMTAAILGEIIRPQDGFEILEAPEYNPIVSLSCTPHRVLALATRWLAGLVSYYGPPDGIDERPILEVRLAPDELAGKRRMLAAFASQNAPSLVATRSYADRFARWQPRQPVALTSTRQPYARLASALGRLLPRALVERLMPMQPGSIGRQGQPFDWRAEWGDDP